MRTEIKIKIRVDTNLIKLFPTRGTKIPVAVPIVLQTILAVVV